MSARRIALTVPVLLCALGCGLMFAAGAARASFAGTASAEVPAPETCPNVALRVGLSASLPDCRAYELVTPPDTEPDMNIYGGSRENYTQFGMLVPAATAVAASVSGDRLMFPTNGPQADAPTDGKYFMSIRGAQGWKTVDLVPRQSTSYVVLCFNAYTPVFTPDLSKAVLADGFVGSSGIPGLTCGEDEPPLVAGEPRGHQNLFLDDIDAGSYQLIDSLASAPAGSVPAEAFYEGASEDLSHIVFKEGARLTPSAPNGAENLYEWSGGTVRLVTYLPDGAPVTGVLAHGTERYSSEATDKPGSASYTHSVSADGSRIVFIAGGDLYVRLNADREQSPLDGKGDCVDPGLACTVELDASQAGGAGGGGQFMWASTDGSRVFFLDDASAGLSSDTAPGSGENLYECLLVTGEAGGPRCQLSDLTAAADARVLGVSGAADDGSNLYFVAEGALTGSEANAEGATAEAGQPNLYVQHDGALRFIATLSAGESLDWVAANLTARTSANGAFIAFNSVRSLTGYNNSPAVGGVCGGEACQEIYLYDATQNKLSCVTCDPSGEPPVAPSFLEASTHAEFGGLNEFYPASLQRNVTDDGRVFFQTAQPLVPRDTNGQYDVYEYEGGRPYLISTATEDEGSYFFELTPSGNDVFFLTEQQLPGGRAEASYSVYDARVDGGFAEPASLTECSEEDCKGAFSAPPAFSAPTSATFAGVGNLTATQPPAKVKTKHKAKGKSKGKGKHKANRLRKKRRSGSGRSEGKHGKSVRVGRARRSARTTTEVHDEA
jgi:hypothetical protein